MTTGSTATTTACHDHPTTAPPLKPLWLSTDSYGLLLLLFSAVLFSGMGAFLKLATNTGLPSTELVFVRALFQGSGVVMGMVYCKSESGRRILWDPFGSCLSIQKIVVARGAIGGLGFILYYYTISALPLGDAVALLSLYPVATVFFARLFLGESIRILNVIVALTSVVGAILIAGPTFLFGGSNEDKAGTYNSLGYVTGVLGAFCASGVVTLIRKAGMVGAHTLQLLFSWCTFGILFSLLFGILFGSQDGGEWHLPPSRASWLYTLGMCTLGSAAHFLLNYAGRLAPAGLSSITRSSDIMWAYLWEVLIFHQKPTAMTYFGVLLICLSLVVITIQKIRDEKNKATEVMPETVPTVDEEEAIEMGRCGIEGSTTKRTKASKYTKVSPLDGDDDTFIDDEITIDDR